MRQPPTLKNIIMINLTGNHSLIGRRFIFLTVLFSSCLALFFTLIQVKFEYDRELSKHAMYHQLINESLLDSLSKSIWTYDDAQIYLQLQGIVKIPTIEQATLTLPDNVKFSVGKIESDRVTNQAVEVIYSPRPKQILNLGQLTLYSGMDETYFHLFKFGGLMLLSNTTKAGLVVLLMLYLIDHLIGRHLYQISRYLSLHQEGQKPVELTLERRFYTRNDELDLLVESLNNMQQRIYFEQRRALAESNKREQLQAQLIEQKEQLHTLERHSGLGEMAATLAHELKQPLSGVVGYAQLSDQLVNESPLDVMRLKDSLTKLKYNGRLAQAIIDRTKRLLQNTNPSLSVVAINPLIERIISLLSHNLTEAGVIITHHHNEQPLNIKVDEIQFEQVLINLIRNAIDALSEQPQAIKQIEITATKDSDMVRIKVEDNGVGISEQVSSQLFKPFFTTKVKGMGIGLTTSLNLMQGMSGSISARNRLERGACFTISLPPSVT